MLWPNRGANKINVHTSFLFFITIKEVLTNCWFVLQVYGLILAIGGVFMTLFANMCLCFLQSVFN